MGQFQDAVDHAGGADETKRAAGFPEAGETIHDSSEAAAVELGETGKIQDDAGLLFTKDFIEGQFQLLAFDAHLERSTQLKDDDAGLQLSFCNLHRRLPRVDKILKGVT